MHNEVLWIWLSETLPKGGRTVKTAVNSLRSIKALYEADRERLIKIPGLSEKNIKELEKKNLENTLSLRKEELSNQKKMYKEQLKNKDEAIVSLKKTIKALTEENDGKLKEIDDKVCIIKHR